MTQSVVRKKRSPHIGRLILLVMMSRILIHGGTAIAQNAAPADNVATSIDALGKRAERADHSAVGCLAKAMSRCGVAVEQADLSASRRFWSTDQDEMSILSEIAADYGLRSTTTNAMSIWQLSHSLFPVILHVRGTSWSSSPDYYILYLGMSGGGALVADQNDDVTQTVPMEFIAAQWTGQGTVIAPADSGSGALTAAAWNQPAIAAMIVLAGLVGAAKLLGGRVRKVATRSTIIFSQALGLLLVSSAIAVACHAAAQDAVWARLTKPANDFRLKAFSELETLGTSQAAPVREISLAEALRLHDSGILFVDARDPNEFTGGHIDGAINVPAGSPDRIRLELSMIPHDRALVVYCGLATCDKARSVAAIMHGLGFLNVSVYTDGWSKWPRKKS